MLSDFVMLNFVAIRKGIKYHSRYQWCSDVDRRCGVITMENGFSISRILSSVVLKVKAVKV